MARHFELSRPEIPLFCPRGLIHCCPLKEPNKISAREVTDPAVYFNRRNFIRTGVLAASAVATGLAYRRLNPVGKGGVKTAPIEGLTTATTNGATGFSVA